MIGAVAVVALSAVYLSPSSDREREDGRQVVPLTPAKQLLLGCGFPLLYCVCQSQLLLSMRGPTPWYWTGLMMLMLLPALLCAAWTLARPSLAPWAGWVSGGMYMGAAACIAAALVALPKTAPLVLVLGIGSIAFVPLASAWWLAEAAGRAAALAAGGSGAGPRAAATRRGRGKRQGERSAPSRELRTQQAIGAALAAACAAICAAVAHQQQWFDQPWLALWPLRL